MIKVIAIGLLLTGFSAKGGARIAELIGNNVFGATDTVVVQWVVAIIVAALGILTTIYKIKDAQPQAPGGPR